MPVAKMGNDVSELGNMRKTKFSNVLVLIAAKTNNNAQFEKVLTNSIWIELC
jgi:hypothetical protein